MKKTVFLIPTLIFGLCLSGCATKNNLNEDVRNQDINDNTAHRNQNVKNNKMPIGNTDNRSKMRVADQAADKVSDLPEVDTANVIVTENNAFVAAKLDRSSRNELTNRIENKISKAVKSADHDIDNVYVSTNPDFYDRMNTYAGDIRNGKPVSGFFNQFNDMVRRVFPNMK